MGGGGGGGSLGKILQKMAYGLEMLFLWHFGMNFENCCENFAIMGGHNKKASGCKSRKKLTFPPTFY
jgi:hypothetical protein